MLKESLNKIKEYFIKGGSNWVILVISLLLAFFMWSSRKLSENYSAYLKYKVDITTNLSSRANKATSTDLLYLNANVSGFQILENNNSDENVILLENLDNKFLKKYKESKDIFYLLTSDVKQKVQDALTSSMQIEGFATDTLFFEIPVQSNRIIPVVPSLSVSYESQYMPVGELVLSPDSIYIYGNEQNISQVESVHTDAIREGTVNSSFSGVVKLKKTDGIRYSTNEIYYSQQVVRYIENTIDIPVTVVNAPSDTKIIVWPKSVKLHYRVPFANAKQYTEKDFGVVVDYTLTQDGSIVKPEISKMPKEVIYYKTDPKFVECLF